MGPQGYSITLDHLSDVQHRQWLDLREMLATGWGIKRKKMLIKRVQDIVPRYQDGPLIALPVAWQQVYGGHAEADTVLQTAAFRRTYTMQSEDETEVDMDHYRKVQALRSSLEVKRILVPGHSFPAPHVSIFGPNRFRNRVQSYDFPDDDPFFSRPTQSATKWHDHKLGKAIRN